MRFPSRVWFAGCVATLALASSGCSSAPRKNDFWSFYVTRDAYGSSGFIGGVVSGGLGSASDPSSACVLGVMIAAFLVAPVAIDIVFLPVTIPHDLVWAE